MSAANYGDTMEGRRRFDNPEIYKETVAFQNRMQQLGVAWHNHFSDECTSDFCCCTGEGNYQHYIPSFDTVIKESKQ